MKRPYLMLAFLTLACAATLAPIRSTPPMLLSDADGGPLEMQQVGVGSNHLRAQPRCPPNLDELISSDRPACLKRASNRHGPLFDHLVGAPEQRERYG